MLLQDHFLRSFAIIWKRPYDLIFMDTRFITAEIVSGLNQKFKIEFEHGV